VFIVLQLPPAIKVEHPGNPLFAGFSKHSGWNHMDRIDTIAFISWSVMLVGLLDFTGWELIGCQTGWLAACFIGRRIIDRWIVTSERLA
jgi:hypothetical protein